MEWAKWAEFWWQSVGGAHAIVNAASMALTHGRSAAIADCRKAPWLGALREAISYAYTVSGGRNSIRDIDARHISSPADHLISLMSDSSGYRPSSQTAADFIKRRGDLSDRILWVTGIEQEHHAAWCKLCKELNRTVQFVLEFEEAGRQVGGAEYIGFSEFVKDYDFHFFALSVAFAHRNFPGTRMRRYAAELASLHHGTDAEGILESLASFSPNAEPTDSGVSPDTVWRAQFRTAYHILEEERRKFIARHARSIQACLPRMQYDEVVEEPDQAEFALLWHLSRPSTPEPHLTLRGPDDELLKFLRESRNSLAHGKPLPQADIVRIFAL